MSQTRRLAAEHHSFTGVRNAAQILENYPGMTHDNSIARLHTAPAALIAIVGVP